MNKIQTVINVVLAAAVVALFVLVFTLPRGTKVVNAEGETVVVAEGEKLPVAYLNLDALLEGYTFAVEANDRLMTKQEDARVKLNSRARTLQNEMEDFQNKLNNNAFLTRERAEAKANELQKKQQDLQNLEAKLTQDLMEETQKLNLQLRDTVDAFLAEFNADGKYQIIFANTASDNVLVAQPGYDITEEVVAALNKRYNSK